MTVQLDWAKIAGGLPEEHDANAAARVMARIRELHHWACLRLQMVPDFSIVPPNVLVGLRKPFTDRCVTFFVNAQGNDMVLIGEGRKAPYVYLTDDAMTLAAEYLEPTKETMTTPREQELEAEVMARHTELEAMAQEVARARASERCAIAETKAVTAKLVQLQADMESLGKSHVGLAQKLGAQEDAIKRARKVCEVSQPRGGALGEASEALRLAAGKLVHEATVLDSLLPVLNAPWEEAEGNTLDK